MEMSEVVGKITAKTAARYDFKNIAAEINELEIQIRSLQRACEKLGIENKRIKLKYESCSDDYKELFDKSEKLTCDCLFNK